MDKFVRVWIIGCLLAGPVCGLCSTISYQDDYLDNLKAAFIFNFTKYLEWPEDDESDTFDIGVIGKNSIVEPLEKIAETERVNQKTIKILQFRNVMEIKACHILFVAVSGKDIMSEILRWVDEQPVLTVSHAEGNAELGIAINFTLIDGKMRFEINLDSLRKSGIHPSSHLLRLAILVGKEKGQIDFQI